MRKTKCKECKGSAVVRCHHCQGGEISVFTIQELRQRKVMAFIDGLSRDEMQDFLRKAFPDDKGVMSFGLCNFYGLDPDVRTGICWLGINETSLPTQSVKIFLEEIEQEEKYRDLKMQIPLGELQPKSEHQEEPEFKWGEDVEVSDDDENWRMEIPRFYGCKSLDGRHIILIGKGTPQVWVHVRKPQKITITLSQIAEKFNCKPEQIVIPNL